MDPITGAVGKEVAASAWKSVQKRIFPNSELKKEIEALKKENEALKAQLDKKAEFERRKAELECRAENDWMYQKKDGTGPYYCQFCVDADERFVPLPQGNHSGTSYCKIHEHYFETQAYRERLNNRPTNYTRSRHPHSWMG